MKRLLLLICTLLCANVLFAQVKFWEGDLQYEVIGLNKVEIDECKHSATIITIPETVVTNGINFNVISIGDKAFNRCSKLTAVIIPNSVRSIGSHSFHDCYRLTSINIPNSVTSIGYCAFRNCSSLTSINIPNGVKSIEDATFEGCRNLVSVDISNGIKSIGNYAFYGCISLTSVNIPNSVTSIGERAFLSCSSLTSVTIPNSVTSIGSSAFSGIESFYSLNIDMTSIPSFVFSSSYLQNLTLGENVRSVASYVFKDSYFLQNITCLGTIPPDLKGDAVFPNPNNIILTVPCNSLKTYSSSLLWNMLFNGRMREDCKK